MIHFIIIKVYNDSKNKIIKNDIIIYMVFYYDFFYKVTTIIFINLSNKRLLPSFP